MLNMKRPMSIEDALERCARFGVKPGLDAIRKVCGKIGNPQDSLRIIHVAGTNGKGAVCALVDAALRAAGFHTGRYTSPHLVSLGERFLIDGIPASDGKIDAAFRRLDSACGEALCELTYFELLTMTAFELYSSENVDYLVLETGLGGRLDATNVVERPAICAITSIGLDHCDWLGHTIAEIAAEKGGIIKPGVPVVLGEMSQEARSVLERIAAQLHASCTYAPEAVVTSPASSTLSLGGLFNRKNADTARTVLRMLGVDQESVDRGFASAVWPGRYQWIENGGRWFLVDGAHNPAAMRALVDSLKFDASTCSLRAPVREAICGFCGDKDVLSALKILREVVDVGISVPIRNPRSLPPERTAELMREAGFENVRTCHSLREALPDASDGTLVCGSLFLAGAALVELNAYPFPCARPCPNESFRAGQ